MHGDYYVLDSESNLIINTRVVFYLINEGSKFSKLAELIQGNS